MDQPESTSSERWEYTLVDTVISAYRDPNNQVNEWLENLNQFGEDGWEVVMDTVIHGKGYSSTQWPVLLLKDVGPVRRMPSPGGQQVSETTRARGGLGDGCSERAISPTCRT